MEQYKFYTVPWSQHCLEAEESLDQSKIIFEKVSLESLELLSAAPRDLGIYRLPALVGEEKIYEGLAAIKRFISDNSIEHISRVIPSEIKK